MKLETFLIYTSIIYGGITMTVEINQETLDSYKRRLQPIVDDLITSSIKFAVTSKSDIESVLVDYPDSRGLYIWSATCDPNLLIAKWNERISLHMQFETNNAESPNPIKTSSGKLINFLLPRVNPQWERDFNPAYLDNEVEIVLYIGKAQGTNVTLRKRLIEHCEASIQTSALKLFCTSNPKNGNKLTQSFIKKDTLLLRGLSLSNLSCKAIVIDESQKDRFLTYERILREVLVPIIGEE